MTSTTDSTAQTATTPPAKEGRGGAMAAALRAAAPAEASASAARSLWWQCRKGLYPVAFGGGLWGLANGLHEQGANPWLVPVGALAVGVGGLALKKVRRWLGKALWRQNWYGGALALAAVWTSAAVYVGPTLETPLPTLLVVGGALAAAPWWWLNRPKPVTVCVLPVREIEAPAVPELVAAPAEPEPHQHQLEWLALVGKPYVSGGEKEALADSVLIDGEPVYDHEGQPNGMAWKIDGRKKYDFGQMRQAMPRILLTYDRPDVFSLVQLERDHAGRTGAGRLVIMERNPLRQEIFWEGPRLERDTGRVPIAIYPDGSGWAYYELYRRGWGTRHDLLAGMYGAGKSTALRAIIAESICAGSALMLFDPHGGGSFEEAKPKVTKAFLDEREIFAGMCGLEAAHKERLAILREVGEKRMGPEFGHPILHVVVDEFAHEYLIQNSIIADILTAEVKEGRKLWIKLSAALQDPSAAAFENNRELRTQLMGGNVLAYRLGDHHATRMVNPAGLDIAPHMIPPTFDAAGLEPTTGLGYVLGATRREMVSRTIHCTQEAFAKHVPHAGGLDERTAEAFQRGYLAGLVEFDKKYGQEQGDDSRQVDRGNVASIDKALTSARDKVAELLEQGPMDPMEIAATGVCSVSHVYRVRDGLVKAGIVVVTEDGRLALKAS